MQTLLVIDNYDSFTHNLVQMFMRRSLSIRVFRNDRILIDQALELRPDFLLVSPGPRGPAHAGISKPIIREMIGKIPILGVCLGMQCLNEVMGGQTRAAPVPVHGKKTPVYHEGEGLFKKMPSPLNAARYHSLMAVPPAGRRLRVTARTGDNVVMGVAHTDYPVFGVQFHPESFMTENGQALIENFLSFGQNLSPYHWSAA